MEEISRSLQVAVAGAGTMGHGLALVMARAGHSVTLLDIDESLLVNAMALISGHLEMLQEEGLLASPKEAVVDRIATSTHKEILREADLVLESISEDSKIKQTFYRSADTLCRSDAVVASNTSYLDIFQLAPPGLQERLLICHFFAPPYLIPLVEVVKGQQTRSDVVNWTKGVLQKAGQKPVVMEKFVPGFIVNRMQRAMGREIFHLLDGGYAKPEEIDKAILASLAIRIPVLGVVGRYDFGGLDFAQKVLSNPSIGLVNEDKPSRTLDDLVADGRLGVKTGKGFYDYSSHDIKEIYRKRDRLLIQMRALMETIEKTFWESLRGKE